MKGVIVLGLILATGFPFGLALAEESDFTRSYLRGRENAGCIERCIQVQKAKYPGKDIAVIAGQCDAACILGNLGFTK